MGEPLPDLDWYLDHVVVPSGEERAAVGPIRSSRARWQRESEGTGVAATQAQAAVTRLAGRQGFVLTRAQVRREGVLDREVRSLVRCDRWLTPRHGVLSPFDVADSEAVVSATAAALVRRGSVVSHQSAALLHGIPLLRDPVVPTLTCTRGNLACIHPELRLYAAGLPPDCRRTTSNPGSVRRSPRSRAPCSTLPATSASTVAWSRPTRHCTNG